MMENGELRVMWLLNHTTLRRFELSQLERLGVSEIYLPKNFPWDEGNLSASITYDYDKNLKLSPEDIELLNRQDWYGNPSADAWEVVNRSFDLIFMGFFPEQIKSVCRNFRGGIILRAFGLGGGETYSGLISRLDNGSLQKSIIKSGKRFTFGMAYNHLADCEDKFVAERSIYMPVGLSSVKLSNDWVGDEKHLLFVCPRIGSSPYFQSIYKKFAKEFHDIPFVVGGAQPIALDDKRILGFLSAEKYAELMTRSRVMFYHSEEPNHIHYHPFEAIKCGMPLVYMAGGMLDLLGGAKLPGRCGSYAEAKKKIIRILGDDKRLISEILDSQQILLDQMNPENCEIPWQQGVRRAVAKLAESQLEQKMRPMAIVRSKKKLALVLPVGYRGGSLRGAIALASAFLTGSRQHDDAVDFIFAHIDDVDTYKEEDFISLPEDISRRPFKWKIMPADAARRAMHYAGFRGWQPSSSKYMIPDDGINNLLDCDLWCVVSDRLPYPVLPLRPIVLVVYDYLQRYVKFMPSAELNASFIDAARSAEKVLVTTEFTYNDARQYAGLAAEKVKKLPMLMPAFLANREVPQLPTELSSYFLWTTNTAVHKNHANAAEALRIYYDELHGQCICKVTGVEGDRLIGADDKVLHLKKFSAIYRASDRMRKMVLLLGELPEADYQRLLRGARFLWHAGAVDNGTFSVIEAACLGVPALSSDYPAMREIDDQFSLRMLWMDSENPRQMAAQLKVMEDAAYKRRELLPSAEVLDSESIESHASIYWQEIRECL